MAWVNEDVKALMEIKKELDQEKLNKDLSLLVGGQSIYAAQGYQEQLEAYIDFLAQLYKKRENLRSSIITVMINNYNTSSFNLLNYLLMWRKYDEISIAIIKRNRMTWEEIKKIVISHLKTNPSTSIMLITNFWERGSFNAEVLRYAYELYKEHIKRDIGLLIRSMDVQTANIIYLILLFLQKDDYEAMNALIGMHLHEIGEYTHNASGKAEVYVACLKNNSVTGKILLRELIQNFGVAHDDLAWMDYYSELYRWKHIRNFIQKTYGDIIEHNKLFSGEIKYGSQTNNTMSESKPDIVAGHYLFLDYLPK